MSQSVATSQRNWMEEDETKSSRWFSILLLLLIMAVGTGLLIRYLLPKHRARIFGLSICIPDYQEQIVLPPIYPRWPTEEFTSQLEGSGFEPWEWLETMLPDSRTRFDQGLEAFTTQVHRNAIGTRDSLIVYIRGHVLVEANKGYLLVGDFDQNEMLRSESVAKIPLQELFAKLANVRAGNVIVLADVCDLSSAPQFGVMVNNIADSIQSALNQVQVVVGQPKLWVIAAADDLQEAHVSSVKKATLLQSACEYATNTMHARGTDFLSLADFYEAVLRYCDHVTAGEQTPVLFHQGVSEQILGKSEQASLAWSLATNVPMLSLGPPSRLGNKTEPDLKDSETDGNATVKEKTAATNRAPMAAPGTPSTESDPKSSLPPAEVAFDKLPYRLRFWAEREQMLRRQRSQGWSPVDFAVAQLHELESQAMRLERAAIFGAPNEAEFRLLYDALERLKEPTRLPSELIPWNNLDCLPEPEQARWADVRQQYRAYFDAMQNLTAWHLAYWHLGWWRNADSPRVVSQLVDSSRALSSVIARLPQDSNAVMFDHELLQADRNSIRRADDQMDLLAVQLHEQAQLKIRELEDDTEKLTWNHESEIQTLLLESQLAFEDRLRLSEAYEKFVVSERFQDPTPSGGFLSNSTAELSSLIRPAEVRLQGLAGWCSALRSALSLGSVTPLPALDGQQSAEELNLWGKQLFEKTADWNQQIDSTVSLAVGWNQTSLSGLGIHSNWSQSFQMALLRPVSQDSSIHFQLSTASNELTITADRGTATSLPILVKRRNGIPITRCWLRLDNAAGIKQPNIANYISIYDYDASLPLEMGKASEVAILENGRLDLMWLLKVAPDTLPPEGFRVELKLAELEPQVNEAKAISIHVMPPKPNFELSANCVNGTTRTPLDQVFLKAGDRVVATILDSMRVPALGHQAKSRYEFFLTNQAPEAKTAVAKVYAVMPPTGVLVGNGTISYAAAAATLHAWNSDSLPPPVLQLGAVQLAPGEKKSIAFQLAPNQQPPLQVGEFGLFCVIEEVLSAAEGASPPRDPNPSFQWINCRPEIGRELVDVRYSVEDRQFQVAGKQVSWNEYQIKEMPIETSVTFGNGQPVPFQNKPLILSLDQLSQKIEFGLRQLPDTDANRQLVAHFTIGQYPRAQRMAVSSSGGFLNAASQAFGWIDAEQSLTLLDADGKSVPVERRMDAGQTVWIVPNRLGVDGVSDGQKASLAKIAGKLRLDLPDIAEAKTNRGILSLADIPLAEWALDRKFSPHFVPEGNQLVFSAAVTDLSFNQDIADLGNNLTGQTKLSLSVSGDTNSLDEVSLLFDKQPPGKGRVEIDGPDGSRLYLGQAVEISITLTDAEAGIQSVYFAIDSGSNGDRTYDSQDWLHKEGKPLPGNTTGGPQTWGTMLEAAEVESLRLPIRSGTSMHVVCRAVDRAGNFSDDHRYATFTWMGTERPVVVPKETKEPKTVEPPPTTYIVNIGISVVGQSRIDPSRVQISGMEAKFIGGNKWICTDVKAGRYDVTASYTDDRGKEYEGKASVGVPLGGGGHPNIILRENK
ncbi:MAG: hypothetical protein KDB03_11525 [Planctomycetales bacterium]|nr:hypothetical protein [Planctomycetales bacterium]